MKEQISTLPLDGHHPSQAFVLGNLSAWLYKEQAELEQLSSEHDLNYCYFIDSIKDTQLALIGNDEFTAVVFRGTQQAVDWLTNFDVEFVSGPYTKDVHKGFFEGVEGAWQELKTQLGSRKHTKLWVSGHSLGGALASLCAAKLVEQGVQVDMVVTFGSPRPGSVDFADKYNELLKDRTYRYVNHNDVVPRVPPRSMSFGHVGNYLHLNESGELVMDKKQWLRVLTALSAPLKEMLTIAKSTVDDHSIYRYLDKLSKHL